MDGAAMDGAAMEGPLFVQSQRFGAKKWKKTWAVLYPSSPNGVARLEFFEHKGSGSGGGWGGSRRLDCRVIRLSDCVSVAPVALDSPPGPGTSAFRLDTAQRSHLLAAEGPASVAWVQILCQTAFPKGSWSQSPGETSSGPSTMEMQENSLYSPHGQGCEFWVTIQKTEASEHCRLQGHYVLRVEASGLSLLMLGGQGQKKDPLLSWPYTLLRRYGRDRAMFSFEAGRRCPSGPGTFTFQTSQGNDIFQAVEAAIQRQKAQAGLAGPGPGQDQQCEAGMAGPGTVPPAPYGLEGPHAADGPALYSEPLDALRALPSPSPDPLYSDPVDSSGQRTGPGAAGSSPLYWGLFDQVHQQLKDTKLGGAKKEPIYDEPEGQSPAAPPGLYDKPQEPRDAWCQRARAQEEGYELPYNPGMDDYAVPPLRNLKPIPPPKPQLLPAPHSPGSPGLPLYSRVLKGAAAKGWDQGLPEGESQTRTGMRSEGPM
ncbi:docking protein 1 isoform X1 [Antechinus flavipes]|uniref:docking protein 1 isoform X1 n=1 Tax=Antechinus flavipes TaxID=38775 RepID=UPI002235D705|nr:docking protein 1 isoform X1 [Antechinus flavipes]